MPTFEKFTQVVVGGAEAVGKSFTAHDDDWEPMAVIERGSGIAVLGLGEVKKEDMVPFLVRYVRAEKARKVGLVVGGWVVTLGPEELDDDGTYQGPPAAKRVDRAEIVVAAIFDAECAEVYVAEVKRHDNDPPRLMEWRALKNGVHHYVYGTLVDPIREALR